LSYYSEHLEVFPIEGKLLSTYKCERFRFAQVPAEISCTFLIASLGPFSSRLDFLVLLPYLATYSAKEELSHALKFMQPMRSTLSKEE